MTKLIGISGNKRSGKDTVAEIMRDNFSVFSYALADRIKTHILIQSILSSSVKITADMINGINYDREKIEYWNPKDLEILLVNITANLAEYGKPQYLKINDLIDEFVADKSNYSIRRLMQFIGTDIGVDLINRDIWVNFADSLYKECKEKDFFVITDLRQEHEFDYIERNNGIIIHINRDSDESTDFHITERNLGHKRHDILINNNDSLVNLKKEVIKVISKLNIGDSNE